MPSLFNALKNQLKPRQQAELCAKLLCAKAAIGWEYDNTDQCVTFPDWVEKLWVPMKSNTGYWLLRLSTLLSSLDKPEEISDALAIILIRHLSSQQKAELVAILMSNAPILNWHYENAAQYTPLPKWLMEYWDDMKIHPLAFAAILLAELSNH